jgi:hypothetical protein
MKKKIEKVDKEIECDRIMVYNEESMMEEGKKLVKKD